MIHLKLLPILMTYDHTLSIHDGQPLEYPSLYYWETLDCFIPKTWIIRVHAILS